MLCLPLFPQLLSFLAAEALILSASFYIGRELAPFVWFLSFNIFYVACVSSVALLSSVFKSLLKKGHQWKMLADELTDFNEGNVEHLVSYLLKPTLCFVEFSRCDIFSFCRNLFLYNLFWWNWFCLKFIHQVYSLIFCVMRSSHQNTTSATCSEYPIRYPVYIICRKVLCWYTCTWVHW